MSLEHSPARSLDRAAYSVDRFCEAHDIGRTLFYRSLKEGWGPVIFKAAGKTLVSVEAAAAWRRRMEANTSDPGPAAAK